jgi:predicted alpha/beta superfamily hydrolase
MNLYQSTLIILLVLFFSPLVSASTEKANQTYIFENEDVALKVDVFLPNSYKADGTTEYPVLYVLDGYWTQGPIRRFFNNLRADNLVPEAIIVSIGYPDKIKNVGNQRLWDLTHAYDAGFKAGGRAPAMLNIMDKNIIQSVEQDYRVDPTRRILTGHSLAGLFTLYAMYQKPDMFTHYAVISPSALWADQALAKLDRDYSKNNDTLSAQVYITYGTDEYAPYVQSLENYIKQLQNRAYQGLNLHLASVKDFRHVSMQNEGFLRGLAWAFSDIMPESPSEFELMNLKVSQ